MVASSQAARLVLQTALPELARLARWVDEVAAEMRLAPDTTFALQLCLEEAVANIVMHGGAPAEAPITVRVEPAGEGVIAVIEDSARPFDPTTVPPRIAPKTIEEARIGELGVHLIRNYASQVQYERHAGRNRLTLRIAPDAGGPA